MTIHKKILFSVSAIIMIFLFLVGTAFSASKANPNPKLPKIITLTSYGVGGHGNLLAVSFSETLTKKLGIRVRPTPADSDMGRFAPVKKGEAEASVITAASVYIASQGLKEFSAKGWGPQKLRLLWAGEYMCSGIIVKANSNMKTWADLKGKRLAYPPGLFTLSIPGYLAYGGLTIDDVVVMKASGYVAAVRMVMSGAADFTQASVVSGITKEFEAAPYGLRFMPMDQNNKEGWKRMRKIAPFLAIPHYVEFGALGEGGPKWLPYYPYTVVTYPGVDEDLVYHMVKGLDEGRDMYKDVQPPLTEQLTLDYTLELTKPVFIPFHSGFIKYAKEKGKWTESHEAWQTKALKEEEERIRAWEAKQ